MRPAVFLLALLSACSTVGGAGPSPATDPVSGSPRTGATPSPGATPSGALGGTNTPGHPSTVTGSVRPAAYDDAGFLGSMARTYLRASPARSLVIEVDYVQGREPSSSALSHLRDVLASVCDKPGGVVVRKGSAVGPTRQAYSVDDIKEIERSSRSARSSGDTVTMWIVYLNGSFAGGTSALGVAYGATSAAIFRDRIDDATTALILASEIERAVVTHEAGHLLALVNIGYTSKIDHEDPEHEKHSKNKDSVMYWAVDDVSLRNVLTGGPPSNFDAADRADLEQLKRG